jgi:hypothetical protein
MVKNKAIVQTLSFGFSTQLHLAAICQSVRFFQNDLLRIRGIRSKRFHQIVGHFYIVVVLGLSG